MSIRTIEFEQSSSKVHFSFVNLEHYDACAKKDSSQKEKSAMLRSILCFVNRDDRDVDGPAQESQENDPDLQM